MNQGENLFQLRDVEYKYPDCKTVFSALNMDVAVGERLVLLGANGCGKTTLLRILAGLSHPQKGEFFAFGRKIIEKDLLKDSFAHDYHRKVGFVFQDSDIQLFCSTVEEELAFGLLQMGLSVQEVKTRIEDLAISFGIVSLQNRSPFRLSGGEKKKVALAAVMSLGPEVLLLDEPTNGLDPRTSRHLVELLHQTHTEGKTIILTTHHLDFAEQLSDRAIVLGENGTIEADGPTEKIIKNRELLEKVNLL